MNDTELLKFADDYLANNAAETGSDELIRQLCFALRVASRQDVSVEEVASIYGQTLATDLLANYVITKRTTEG